MRLKISLDLDDTIFSFINYYIEKFGMPEKDSDITRHIMGYLRRDTKFWLEQPVLNIPNFVPHCYCTARVISKQLIKKQIRINNLPLSPIYQILGFGLSKVPQLKRAKVDCHIDDSIKNFIDLNLNGIPCLLLDNPHNRKWGPIGRIFSLDIDEIEDCYNLFMLTAFERFKDLLYEYLRHQDNTFNGFFTNQKDI